jgi:hypothetical protein
MTRALVVALLCVAQIAVAAPRSVLVLRAEGTADTASRTSIDTHVVRLSKNIEGKVEAGDITLSEAAAAVGCNASEPACKDDVLTTFGVDEMIATTVTATPTGLNVTVRRIARGNTRAAQTTIPSGKAPDAKLDTDIGPLFGVVAAAPPPEAKPVPVPQPATAPAPPPIASQPEPAQPASPTGPATTTVPAPTAPPATTVTAAPAGVVMQPAPEGRSRRWQKVGMGVGGAFVLLSFIMWSQAADVQKQIDELEDPRSHAELDDLRALEKRGDDLAGGGNLFFLTGVALGTASAYLYWRAGKSSSAQTARIAPAAFPQGAGVTLTIGGMP